MCAAFGEEVCADAHKQLRTALQKERMKQTTTLGETHVEQGEAAHNAYKN